MTDKQDLFEAFDELGLFDMYEIEKIVKSHGAQIKWGDSGISDGCDDEEDTYVMYQSFDVVFSDGSRQWIKVYYGDITGLIGEIKIMD